MQRFVNLLRRPREKLWLCRRFATDAEIEQKFFQKGPLDPVAVDLMEKFESDIIYSSYVEENKKPVSYRHKPILRDMCEKEKKRIRFEEALRKPFSLALKYSAGVLPDATSDEPPKPMVTAQDTIPDAIEKLQGEQDTSRNIIISETKLEIFRQMRQRQAELEEVKQKYPDKWMQDYETYDEVENDDLTADSEYGTPGKCRGNNDGDLSSHSFRFALLSLCLRQIQAFQYRRYRAMAAALFFSAPILVCPDICPVN